MKYGSFFLVLCLLISGCSNEQTKHLGTWKSSPTQLIKGEGSSIKLTFTDSNKVIWDGVNEGYSIYFDYNYKIDYSKNPIQLDIVVTLKETGDVVGRYFGIVRFPSEGVMEYRIKHNGPWYNSFDPNDKESTLLLKLMSE